MPTQNPDLLWGLRGGGGTFGIVTSFEIRAHPLDPSVLAGPLLFPAEEASDALRAHGDFAKHAPRELTTVANLRWAPPVP